MLRRWLRNSQFRLVASFTHRCRAAANVSTIHVKYHLSHNRQHKINSQFLANLHRGTNESKKKIIVSSPPTMTYNVILSLSIPCPPLPVVASSRADIVWYCSVILVLVRRPWCHNSWHPNTFIRTTLVLVSKTNTIHVCGTAYLLLCVAVPSKISF